MRTDPATLLKRFADRDRRALAEVLSLVESGSPPSLPPGDTWARVIGITGSGGAGKSTLVSGLMGLLRGRQLTVAVLACDPQSPRTGGALLGDRVRARFDPADEGVYFRSLSTRGAPGGISAATGPSIDWLCRFGFDVILVETVGVGQDQVAVRDVVDTLVLLVTPNSGDEIQWEKAGLIELVDLVVINKADLPGADRLEHQLESALSLDSARRPPILRVIATSGEGLQPLWQQIESMRP